MRIGEFTDKEELPFDVVEDTLVFMRNDPVFYRKYYYPSVCELADCQRAGKDADPKKYLTAMIEMGCDNYVKKYNVGRNSEEVFTAEDRSNLLQELTTKKQKIFEKATTRENL